MAIFRGTGGSGNSTDDSIVSAVTTQAGIATTKAGEAATSATTATTKASEASASATTASTKATEATASATTASTKATEANTAKTGAETAQTAAESARNTAQTHANTANNSSVQTVAGISTEVQNVNNIRTEIQNVDTVKTDVTTVAGISSNVTTVAADASDIGTVATNIANVNNVGDNIANVNAVHSNASNINTVAADGTDIGTVSSNISNVNTVAGISSNVTTVAGLEAKMDTVIADASDIGAVAGNIGDVTTVSGINSEVDTVAGIAAKVTTVADNITDVQNADTNAANASTSASQAANSASAAGASATTASTKATEASNSATAASNSATTATTKATEAAGSATTAGTSASTATTKASEASASATTATTKAGEAASSASAASGDATTSTTKASEASASATSAATSATNAQTAANAWSGYFNTYLGSYSAPPTVDSQGNALQTGAFYYDTGAGSNTVGLYVYNGSTWVYSTNYNNVTAPYSLAQDLATNGNDINFGDNDKASFGASSDLQIRHDSTYNRNLIRTQTDVPLMFHHNSSNVGSSDEVVVGQFVANSEANNQGFRSILSLQHTTANANKAGRIVVESNSSFSNSVHMYLQTGHSTSVAPRDRIKIANNGDISFFEDTGTTPKFFWDASTERLGIGTTSPTQPVHIKAATNIPLLLETTHSGGNSRIRFRNENHDKNLGVNNDGQFTLYDITNGKTPLTVANNVSSNTLVLNGSSNVGIGTNAPTAKLHVQSGGKAIQVNNTNENTHMTFGGDRAMFGYARIGTADMAVVQGASGKGVAFCVNNNTFGSGEKVRIDSSGNVGIGTDSIVDSRLHLKTETSCNLRIEGGDPNSKNIVFVKNTGGAQQAKITAVGENLYFTTGTTHERMRIDSSGNVGIGTASPDNVGSSKTLHINDNTHGGAIRLSEAGDNGFISYDNPTGMRIQSTDIITLKTANTERMRIDANGHVIVPEGITLGTAAGTYNAANTLDDYEEGDWTMRIQESGTGNQSSSTNANCKYTKIGRVVHVQGHIVDINNDAFAGTGTLQLVGLPFTQLGSHSTRANGSCQVNGLSGTGVEKGLFVQGQSGTNYVLIKFQQTNSGAGTITTASLSNNDTTDIFFSLTYTTT